MSSEVQKSEQSLSFLVFSNIFVNSIKFYLKVYFCKNKSEAELIYLCGNVLKTLFWFYSLYRNMAKLSQEHFRSLYIHIHNQTHIPVRDIAGEGERVISLKFISIESHTKNIKYFLQFLFSCHTFYPVIRLNFLFYHHH